MIAALVLIAGGLAAGVFGSLLGLGGGILIVPLLALGFGLPLHEAIGVSLVAVIATSGAAASVYLDRGVANLRLGMTLELFTASGALIGALIAFAVPDRALAALFAALLGYVAVTMLRGARAAAAREGAVEGEGTRSAALPGAGPTGRFDGPGYRVDRFGVGIAGSLFAGIVSALLGVGGGIVKVPLMHLAMGVPLRVATATSNLMIGITATSGAIVYLVRGEIAPLVAGPTVLGVYVGARAGARVAHRLDLRFLRILFTVVLGWTAFQMTLRALGA